MSDAPVDFWTTLFEQLWAARTPIVVALYVLTRAAVRIAPHPVERYHVRFGGALLLFHVAALTTAVCQDSYGYASSAFRTASFACESLCVLSLAITMVFRALLPRVGFVLPRILIDLFTAAGCGIVFIAVGHRAGFSVAGLITTSAVLTAVIGFSLQDTLSNVMGGLSVELDKSISVGDWITVNGMHGRVTEIRWRYTAIEMRNWDTAIIPNGVIVKSQVTIMGRRQGMQPMQRRPFEFFVDYRSAPSVVMRTVQDALRSDPIPNVATDPAPQCLFWGYKDSTAQFMVRYWLTDLGIDDPTDSAVRTRVWFALRRAGIPLAIPASTVFLTPETPERDARKADRDHARRLQAIAKVDLFHALSEEQRGALAAQLSYMPFATGEAVTHEGEHDEGLFMLVEGEASVRIGKGHENREVAKLGPGEFFGEMALMTGEVRTATVIATTDLVCYRMSKAAFQEVIEEAPVIADQIAEVLMTRKHALEMARDEHETDRKRRMESAKRDLATRIRGFFGLDAAR